MNLRITDEASLERNSAAAKKRSSDHLETALRVAWEVEAIEERNMSNEDREFFENMRFLREKADKKANESLRTKIYIAGIQATARLRALKQVQ